LERVASSGINKRGIEQFMRTVQKEMDKHPLASA
jgi:hypothetical protein